MQVGDLVKVRDNYGDIGETLWEVVGFEVRGGQDFVRVKHPEVGGIFSFHAKHIVEDE
jgi:hypothetical protein